MKPKITLKNFCHVTMQSRDDVPRVYSVKSTDFNVSFFFANHTISVNETVRVAYISHSLISILENIFSSLIQRFVFWAKPR